MPVTSDSGAPTVSLPPLTISPPAASPAGRRPRRRRARDERRRSRGALVAAAAGWGLAAPVLKHATTGLPPGTLLTVELAAATMTLWTVVIVRGHRPVRHLRRITIMALLDPVLTSGAWTLGLATASSMHATLISSAESSLVAVGALAFFRERLRRSTWAGLAVATCGLWIVQGTSAEVGQGLGAVLIGVATLAAATYSLLASRVMPQEADPVASTAWQFLIALLVCAPAGILQAADGTLTASGANLSHWAAAALAGAVGVGLPYLWYNRALTVIPVGEASVTLCLTPVAGLVAAAVLLGESLTALKLAGAAVTVTGTLLVVIRR
ncbi:DMT family transporter [Microbispora sp. NBRC 16548]|uniref:DMT family transporter n=1 Tax=Microbispora sp. NBRC 16548 TaxID=3030994 RepID=UPI0024A3E037|nr:DMT family transporter [Microbispora sp. NBRC 16548]GLX06613.1 hypothetical protein Misp03_35400 [Microbispora sp. NBRC 16548]